MFSKHIEVIDFFQIWKYCNNTLLETRWGDNEEENLSIDFISNPYLIIGLSQVSSNKHKNGVKARADPVR